MTRTYSVIFSKHFVPLVGRCLTLAKRPERLQCLPGLLPRDGCSTTRRQPCPTGEQHSQHALGTWGVTRVLTVLLQASLGTRKVYIFTLTFLWGNIQEEYLSRCLRRDSCLISTQWGEKYHWKPKKKNLGACYPSLEALQLPWLLRKRMPVRNKENIYKYGKWIFPGALHKFSSSRHGICRAGLLSSHQWRQWQAKKSTVKDLKIGSWAKELTLRKIKRVWLDHTDGDEGQETRPKS